VVITRVLGEAVSEVVQSSGQTGQYMMFAGW